MRRKNVKRFTVELSPEDYDLLEFLTQELNTSKADIVRVALRRYIAEWISTLHVTELKAFLEFIRSRLHDKET